MARLLLFFPPRSNLRLPQLDQQRTELFVAGFADPMLLLNRAGLVATWCQTEIGRYISRMIEPPGFVSRNFLFPGVGAAERPAQSGHLNIVLAFRSVTGADPAFGG